MRKALLGAAFSGFSLATQIFFNPANALPGQSVNTVSQWVDSHPIFGSSNLKAPPDDPYGHPAYANLYQTDQVTYAGGSILFSADLSSFQGSKSNIVNETIYLTGIRSTPEFGREDTAGNDIIRDVWGEEVLREFVNSRYTDHIEGDCGSSGASYEWDFYMGERYGFIAQPSQYAPVQADYGFQVMDLTQWEYLRNSYRNGDSCWD